MNLIWATRGRLWGFRFLLDGGYEDPLAAYESAFSGAEDEAQVCVRVGDKVALRFPDPLGRQDAAGRVIPHDFVVLDSTRAEDASAHAIDTVDDGVLTIWPLVAGIYARVWDSPGPPDVAALRAAFVAGGGQTREDDGSKEPT